MAEFQRLASQGSPRIVEGCGGSRTSVVERPPRENPGATERARHLFESGEQHYNLGEFTEAAQDFEAAYAESANYVLLYNVGQAYRQAGDRQRAIDAYQRYLDEGGARVNQAIRNNVTDQIQKLSAPMIPSTP